MFIENCQKNKVDLTASGGINSSRAAAGSVQTSIKHSRQAEPVARQVPKKEPVDPLVQAVQDAMKRVVDSQTLQELGER